MNRRGALRSMMASVAVVGLAGCQSLTIPTPFGRVGGDGHPLSLAVQRALLNAPTTSGIQIEVTTREDEIIILKGTVDNEDQRYEAERVANGVDGVRRVDSILYVSD